MKKILLISTLLLAVNSISAFSSSLVVDGGFSSPNENGSWAPVANGGVLGWTNTLNNDGIEVGAVTVYGASTYVNAAGQAYTQLAELNGSTFDTISQTITGLTVGETYNLSWAYGERAGSGFEQTNVYLGGALVATDTDQGTSSFQWNANSYEIVATSTSETLVFQAINTSAEGGSPNLGNAITAVSLNAVPEPSLLALLILGLPLMSLTKGRKV